jgi:hypothetical protein
VETALIIIRDVTSTMSVSMAVTRRADPVSLLITTTLITLPLNALMEELGMVSLAEAQTIMKIPARVVVIAKQRKLKAC